MRGQRIEQHVLKTHYLRTGLRITRARDTACEHWAAPPQGAPGSSIAYVSTGHRVADGRGRSIGATLGSAAQVSTGHRVGEDRGPGEAGPGRSAREAAQAGLAEPVHTHTQGQHARARALSLSLVVVVAVTASVPLALSQNEQAEH
eukprot:1718756-Rhodomonas_salina.1